MVKAVVYLDVTPPLNDWEVVGSNPMTSMSRIVFYPGKEFQWFSLTENVSYSFSTQHDHLVAHLYPLCFIVVIKVKLIVLCSKFNYRFAKKILG